MEIMKSKANTHYSPARTYRLALYRQITTVSIFFGMFFLQSASSWGATYYIDPIVGDDSSTGTSPTDSWRTLSNVTGVNLLPGDNVLFSRGGSWNEVLEVNNKQGTIQNPITFSAYGSGDRPILKEIYIRNNSRYIAVSDIVVDHQKQSGDAVRIRDSDDIELKNMEVRNGLQDGIDFNQADRLVIDGLYIHHLLAGSFSNQIDAHGIAGSDSDIVTIRNTEISHVSGDSFQADPDRDNNIVNNILIENCHFWTSPLIENFNSDWRTGERPGENAIDTKVVKSDWANVSRMQITVRDTIAHGWQADGFIGNKAAFNMKEKIEAVFDRVTVYDSEIAFRIRGDRGNANTTIKNAVIYGVNKAFRTEDNLMELTIVNSTLGSEIDEILESVNVSTGTDSWDLRNNAIFATNKPSAFSDASNLTVVESDFEDASTHNYRITESSILLDAGVTISSVTTDRDGNSRMEPYDVGAFEFRQGTEGNTPRPPEDLVVQ